VLLAFGFVLCASTNSLTHVIVRFGVLVGIGNGFGYATAIPTIDRISGGYPEIRMSGSEGA
jgi:hypothetical protein